METLLKEIDDKLLDIRKNSSNIFIIKICNSIEMKLEYIKDKTFISRESVYNICNTMIYDLDYIYKRYPTTSDDIIKDIEVLKINIEKIKTAYFH